MKTKRGLARFLRTTADGLLRVDRAAVSVEAHLDGKYLLRSSDPTLSAEDIALGYKQLLQVERGWRDLKTTLDLRPVHHRREDRIHAHVLLCWLALLLIRIIEHETTDTWRNVRNELLRLHLATFTGPAGTCQQRTELTAANATCYALSSSQSPRASPACSFVAEAIRDGQPEERLHVEKLRPARSPT